jgi:archaemetzincin
MIDRVRRAAYRQAIMAICFSIIGFAGAMVLSRADARGASRMEQRIILVPLGQIEGWVLDALERDLGAKFRCRVERQKFGDVPRNAFDPARNQYISSLILDQLNDLPGQNKQAKFLGIAEVDLYTSGLNFVFGQAEFRGKRALISLARLRQSFYALPENKALFLERAKKEAVHELGHVFGLDHCPDPLCVMHFSNSLLDTDKKHDSFCSQCRARLDKLLM